MRALSLAGLLAALATAAHAQAAAPCAAPEHRQLDFWAGDWDGYDIAEPTKVVARNHVTPMLGGCALREVYEQSDGLVGESFSAYSAARGLWHHSWVTNRGTLLLLDGRLEGGRMVLSGTNRTSVGVSSVVRAEWWLEGKNVREKAERSTDAGKTWTPMFDMVFRPHGTT